MELQQTKKVYDWLKYVYENTQAPIHRDDFALLKSIRKFKLGNIYMQVLKREFLDSSEIKDNCYKWDSIRPNVKMANRVISEVNSINSKYKKSRDFTDSLGIKKSKQFKPWSESDEALLKKLAKEEKPMVEISESLGRTYKSIKAKSQKLGISLKGTKRKTTVLYSPISGDFDKITNDTASMSQKNDELKDVLINQKQKNEDNYFIFKINKRIIRNSILITSALSIYESLKFLYDLIIN